MQVLLDLFEAEHVAHGPIVEDHLVMALAIIVAYALCSLTLALGLG